MSRPHFILRSLVCWVGLWLGSAAAWSEEVRFLRIGTGSTAGTYYAVGTLIGSAISNPPGSRSCAEGGSCGVPGVVAAAQSTMGSVANIKGLVDGSLDLALVQADVALWAAQGQGPFNGQAKQTDLRAIARLYAEAVHIVVRRGAKITSLRGLRGQRVSLDTLGSGTRQTALLVLKSVGLSEATIKAKDFDPDGNIDGILTGSLDAFFYVGGYPAFAVQELAKDGLVDLLAIPVADSARLQAIHPFFSTLTIPDATYPGIDETATLGVNALLVTTTRLSDELVARLTAALWHEQQKPLFAKAPVISRDLTIDQALTGVAIPLHAGAEAYYRQVGLIKAAATGPSLTPEPAPQPTSKPTPKKPN